MADHLSSVHFGVVSKRLHIVLRRVFVPGERCQLDDRRPVGDIDRLAERNQWGGLSDYASQGQAFLYSFLLQGVAFTLMAALPGMNSFIIAAVLLGFTLRATYNYLRRLCWRLRSHSVLIGGLRADVGRRGPRQCYLAYSGRSHRRQRRHELVFCGGVALFGGGHGRILGPDQKSKAATELGAKPCRLAVRPP